MRHCIAMFGGALVVTSALCSTASAQERGESYLVQHLRAPSDSLELKIGTGYTQGFGNVAPGRRLSDMSGAGVGASIDLDYRLSRPWSIGVEGQYQELSPEQNSSARGLAANVGVTYHFTPVLRGDPWARLGTGYRLLWENDPAGTPAGTTTVRHGFELLAAKIGYDVRVSEDVAIAPVIGADLDVFVWEAPSNGSSTPLTTAQVGSFVYAGLQGRFDLGGTRDGIEAAAKREPPAEPPMGVMERQPDDAVPPPIQETPPPVVVSEDILRACQMNLGAIDKAPRFGFDKAEVLPDHDTLQQVADCFTTGPLKDARLQLVGRADPRGSATYNEALGMKRAHAIAGYLEQLGVAAAKIDETSRGKLDARGQDEATWAIDRRVDILLAY